MSLALLITLGGHLRVTHDPESVPDVSPEAAEALEKAFSQSSAEGLLLLASAELADELPATFVFWRLLARQFFQAVCHLGEGGFPKWQSIAAPSEAELASLVAEAPPMRGLEYLTAELLLTL